MVKVYGKCGLCEKAQALVSSMFSKYGIKPTVVVYTCLISGLIRRKKVKEAWETFKAMSDTYQPDPQCVSTIVQGLTDAGMWKEIIEAMQDSAANKVQVPPECVNQA